MFVSSAFLLRMKWPIFRRNRCPFTNELWTFHWVYMFFSRLLSILVPNRACSMTTLMRKATFDWSASREKWTALLDHPSRLDTTYRLAPRWKWKSPSSIRWCLLRTSPDYCLDLSRYSSMDWTCIHNAANSDLISFWFCRCNFSFLILPLNHLLSLTVHLCFGSQVCPFSRVVFHFGFDNKSLIKEIEDFVHLHNAACLDLGHFERNVIDAALSTYKLSP